MRRRERRDGKARIGGKEGRKEGNGDAEEKEDPCRDGGAESRGTKWVDVKPLWIKDEEQEGEKDEDTFQSLACFPGRKKTGGRNHNLTKGVGRQMNQRRKESMQNSISVFYIIGVVSTSHDTMEGLRPRRRLETSSWTQVFVSVLIIDQSSFI